MPSAVVVVDHRRQLLHRQLTELLGDAVNRVPGIEDGPGERLELAGAVFVSGSGGAVLRVTRVLGESLDLLPAEKFGIGAHLWACGLACGLGNVLRGLRVYALADLVDMGDGLLPGRSSLLVGHYSLL